MLSSMPRNKDRKMPLVQGRFSVGNTSLYSAELILLMSTSSRQRFNTGIIKFLVKHMLL